MYVYILYQNYCANGSLSFRVMSSYTKLRRRNMLKVFYKLKLFIGNKSNIFNILNQSIKLWKCAILNSKPLIKYSSTCKLNDFWAYYKCGKSLKWGCILILLPHITNITFLCRTQIWSLICRWHSKGLESALDTRIYLCSSRVLPVCLTDFCVPLPLAAGRGNRGNSTCQWVCVKMQLQHFHATICQRSLNLIIIIIIIQLHHHRC